MIGRSLLIVALSLPASWLAFRWHPLWGWILSLGLGALCMYLALAPYLCDPEEDLS